MRPTAAPVGSEFRANTYTSSDQIFSSVTALNDGGFVVTWSSDGQDGSGYGIYGQRYAADGTPVGSEFRANTYTTSDQIYSSVTALNDGGFVVTWSSFGQDGSGWGIYGQRYAADGTPVGGEFRANTYTSSDQIYSLRDGAQRRRLRGDVVVGRTRTAAAMASTASAMRRTALRWGASSTPTRTPPATRSIPP